MVYENTSSNFTARQVQRKMLKAKIFVAYFENKK